MQGVWKGAMIPSLAQGTPQRHKYKKRNVARLSTCVSAPGEKLTSRVNVFPFFSIFDVGVSAVPLGRQSHSSALSASYTTSRQFTEPQLTVCKSFIVRCVLLKM